MSSTHTEMSLLNMMRFLNRYQLVMTSQFDQKYLDGASIFQLFIVKLFLVVVKAIFVGQSFDHHLQLFSSVKFFY